MSDTSESFAGPLAAQAGEQQLARRCLKHESAACLSCDIPVRLRGGSQGPGRSYAPRSAA